ncbi:Uncharacterized protein DAT39_004635, partial [Clarias magur]
DSTAMLYNCSLLSKNIKNTAAQSKSTWQCNHNTKDKETTSDRTRSTEIRKQVSAYT